MPTQKPPAPMYAFQVLRVGNEWRWRLVIYGAVIIHESSGWPNKLAAGEAARLARLALRNAQITQIDE